MSFWALFWAPFRINSDFYTVTVDSISFEVFGNENIFRILFWIVWRDKSKTFGVDMNDSLSDNVVTLSWTSFSRYFFNRLLFFRLTLSIHLLIIISNWYLNRNRRKNEKASIHHYHQSNRACSPHFVPFWLSELSWPYHCIKIKSLSPWDKD